MKLLIILKQFLNDLQKQKLRTFLTTFGIVWGTAAIIILVSFGEGIMRHQKKQFIGLGENLVIVWPGRTSKVFNGLPKGRPVRVNDDQINALKVKVPGIVLTSPEYSNTAKLTYNRKTVSQNIIGVQPEFGVVRNLIPEAGGRFIDQMDYEYRKRVCFLGTSVRDDLFGEGANPVGKYLVLRGSPFLVIGVLKHKDQNSSYRGRDRYKVYIPASTHKAMFSREYPNNFIYQVNDPEKSEMIEKQVFAALGKTCKFDPDDDQALMIWDTNETIASFMPFFTGFKIFLGIIGVFTLIVGGIGTANIMYVVVKERTKEIGIKMALGARRGYIMAQIIVESLLITAIGGTCGFLIAKGFESLFPLMQVEEYVGNPTITNFHVMVTISIIGFIGLLAGYFPARRAVRLNPVEALRL